MNNKPLISVVTVTYNAEEFLEKTIQSVIEQDYTHIEYIIIDGGSTDSTLDIIKKYDSYITYWISEPDSGIYDAMNKATLKAKGSFINFMNAGDIFTSKNCVSCIVDNLEPHIDIISGDAYHIHTNGEKEYKKNGGIEAIVSHCLPFCHQSTFIKTSLMKEYKYSLRYKYSSDYDFFLKAYTNKKIFKIINHPISNYLLNGFSLYNATDAMLEILTILNEYKPKNYNTLSGPFFKHFLQYHEEHFNITNNLLTFSKNYNKIYDQAKTYVHNHSKIILYGNGKVSELVQSFPNSTICGIIDKNNEKPSAKGIPLYTPKEIDNLDYDILLITVLGREESIIQDLLSISNIDKNKIKVFSFDD